MLRYYLVSDELAISGLRCGTVRGPGNLNPPTHGRAKGVSERYVLSTRPQLQQRLWVPIEELISPKMVSLDEFVYVICGRHKITSIVDVLSLRSLSAAILRYSPKCVEGVFCEVELPLYGVLR